MAQEIGYSRQVAPQVAAPMPLTTPNSFGAQIGQQVAEIGQQLHQEALQNYSIDRQHTADEEWAGFQHGFALARENITTIGRTMAEHPGPGLADAMSKNWEAQRSALLDKITDPRVQQRATAEFDNYGVRVHAQAAQAEEVARVAGVMHDWSSYEQVATNRARRLTDVSDYLDEQQIGDKALAGLNMPDQQRAAAQSHFHQSLAVSFLQGMNDRDPQLAKAMLTSKKGIFDDVLQPQQVQVLLNEADVNIRRNQVQADQSQKQAIAAAKEQVKLTIAQQGNGKTFSTADWIHTLDLAKQTGDPLLLERATQAAYDSRFVQIYRGDHPATPNQLQARMSELAAMPKRTDEQDREYKWLQDNYSGISAAFDRDPAGFLIRSGGAPQLDWNDPASLQQRVQWARSETEATGRYVPPISEADAAPLRDAYDQGDIREVYAALDKFHDPMARVEAARVVAPSDSFFQRMVVMPAPQRATIERGREALKANSQLLTPIDKNVKTNLQTYEGQLRAALTNMNPVDAAAFVQASKYLLAGLLTTTNTSIEDVNAATLKTVFSAPLGMTEKVLPDGTREQLGGIGMWTGQHPFVVPEGMSRQQWMTAMQADLQAKQAKGEGPVNPDGSPANLNKVYPVWLGGHSYRWETAAGQSVYTRSGKVFVSQVAP